MQIRRTIRHPDAGELRNGTSGQVLDIDHDRDALTLRLTDSRDVMLDRQLAASADLRLAYVQHPFPAQGQTSDTAHVIVSELATAEGCYVAVTRARQTTHIYTALDQLDLDGQPDRFAALADRVSHTEPELPSITTPLAHEGRLERNQALEQQPSPGTMRAQLYELQPVPRRRQPERESDHAAALAQVTSVLGAAPDPGDPNRSVWEHAARSVTEYRARYGITSDERLLLGPQPAAGEFGQRRDRRQAAGDLIHALETLNPTLHRATEPQQLIERAEQDERVHEPTIGFEP